MMDRDACPSPGVLQFMGSQRAGYDWATELNWTESIWTALKILFGRNDAKAETPVLWPPHAKSWLIGKDSDAARDWGQDEKGTTEDEMAGWRHWLNGREFEWTPGVGDGQGGLACCDSWGRRVGHDWATELNWTERLWGLVKLSNLPNFTQLVTSKTEYNIKVHIDNFCTSSITIICLGHILSNILQYFDTPIIFHL